MLDPLTALSLASAIVQFVDFGCKLLSQSQELYHSADGALKANITTEEITLDVIALSHSLRKKEVSAHDVALGKLVDSCEREAEELLRILADLRLPQDGATKWDIFRKAIRSVRKKGKIEEIEGRLGKIQRQVNSRLLFMLKYAFIYADLQLKDHPYE